MKKIKFFLPIALISLIISASSCTGFQPIADSGSSSSTGNTSKLRSDIVTYARQYKGTKYKYAGKTPKGFDCSGFTSYVMDHFGIQITSQSGIQETEGKPVSARDARPGDLVFFRKRKSGNVFHVALIVANGADGIRVIHATSSRGVVEDNIEQSSYWSSKYATTRNVIGD